MQSIDTIVPSNQQLIWLNRNRVVKVLANSKRASSGALVVQQVVIPVGHEISVGTLAGWMTRETFDALKVHNETNLGSFELILGDDVMDVMWDNTGGVAIDGDDLYTIASGDDTLTNVTMKFLTV